MSLPQPVAFSTQSGCVGVGHNLPFATQLRDLCVSRRNILLVLGKRGLVRVNFPAERVMGCGQFADLGMFLQTFMLLCEEAGLATCAQEAWANHWEAAAEFCDFPPEQKLFCGMAVGYADRTAKINALESERDGLDVVAKWVSAPGAKAKL